MIGVMYHKVVGAESTPCIYYRPALTETKGKIIHVRKYSVASAKNTKIGNIFKTRRAQKFYAESFRLKMKTIHFLPLHNYLPKSKLNKFCAISIYKINSMS